MKYKLFPTPVFNHFIQPSPPIAKLKSLHGVLRGQIPPWKWLHSFAACPSYENFKISPPSPISIITIIRQHTKFPLRLDSPGKPDHQIIHYLTAISRLLSRGSVTNPMFITVLHTYLTPRSPGVLVWVKTLPILNVAH